MSVFLREWRMHEWIVTRGPAWQLPITLPLHHSFLLSSSSIFEMIDASKQLFVDALLMNVRVGGGLGTKCWWHFYACLATEHVNLPGVIWSLCLFIISEPSIAGAIKALSQRLLWACHRDWPYTWHWKMRLSSSTLIEVMPSATIFWKWSANWCFAVSRNWQKLEEFTDVFASWMVVK